MSSSPKLENVEDSPSDGAFEELHKYINDVHDILKRETNKLRKEKEALTRWRGSWDMFPSRRC